MTTRNGKISDEALRGAIDRARRLSEPEPEPFRSIAFRTLLDYLLSHGSAMTEPRSAAPAPGLGLNEFLASRRAETHPDRVLAIAYYQERYNGGEPITTKDLVDAYQRARLKRPQNFPDVIATLVRKGHLVEQERRDGLKSWGITGTGVAHVERDL
ncbi:MAG: hypothetical protein ACR2PL_11800 [Dehalococcoidia bacterium]